MRALRLCVSLLILVGACDGDEPGGTDAGRDAGVDAGGVGETVDPTSLDLEADPPGEWLAGDLHVHATGASNDTGGDSFPEDIARVARERGLFFVVLTDHSNSTGSDPSTLEEDPALFNQGPEFPYWDEAAALSEPGAFLMIDGNEISPVAAGERPSEPTGHVGCVPADLEAFDREGAFTDRPRGAVTGGEVLAQARARGCFTVLNHPWGAPWTSFDWTSFDYDAMEIWNGTAGLDAADRSGHAAWRCDLLAGRAVTPIAASDNHRVFREPPGEVLHPALGFPRTHVFARERTWLAIVEGLRAGRVALGEGESALFLDAYAEDGARDASGATRWLRVRGRLDARARNARLRLTRATGCVDTRAEDRAPPEPTETVLLERTIAPGEPFDWAVRVEGEPGVHTAVLDARGGHWGALSGAVVIEGSGGDRARD
ncbi:MAG TPA: CehA/McbA family metallohydrolase [Sandaracinaceae bacterium LLY-WYZ-13_1]|nr:CehA/McbA family metallohydrolase [Sandaracinaceae bacterium LLY-WYZ-13_1]